jgi:hypothetical protein
MSNSLIPVSPNLQSLAARYQLDPLRVLELIDEELTASDSHMIFDDNMIPPDLKAVADEQGITPDVVLMALDTEMYFRSLSQARTRIGFQNQ